MLQLEQKNGELIFALDKQRLSIGRDSSNDLVLDDSETSGFHANIFVEGGGVEIVDLGSTNGVLVNGKTINSREQIKAWDRVKIGATEFEVVDTDGRRPTRVQPIIEQQPSDVHVASVKSEAKAVLGRLQLITEGDYPSVISIPKDLNARVIIGREGLEDQKSNGISAFNLRAPAVSARHAEIVYGESGAEVIDLNSTNGTFVNDKRVHRHPLRHGDRLRFDEVEYRFVIEDKSVEETRVKPAVIPGGTIVRGVAQQDQFDNKKSQEEIEMDSPKRRNASGERRTPHIKHPPHKSVIDNKAKFISKLENICAIGLIIFFFLPWINIAGFISVSGYELPDVVKGFGQLAALGSKTGKSGLQSYFFYLVYLIPIFSALTIYYGVTDEDKKVTGLIADIVPFSELFKVTGLIAAIVPISLLFYALIKMGTDVFDGMAIGAWLTLATAIAMLLSVYGIIKLPVQTAISSE